MDDKQKALFNWAHQEAVKADKMMKHYTYKEHSREDAAWFQARRDCLFELLFLLDPAECHDMMERRRFDLEEWADE